MEHTEIFPHTFNRHKYINLVNDVLWNVNGYFLPWWLWKFRETLFLLQINLLKPVKNCSKFSEISKIHRKDTNDKIHLSNNKIKSLE